MDGFDAQVFDSLDVPCLIVQAGGGKPKIICGMPVEIGLKIASDYHPSCDVVDEIRGGGVFAKL